MNDQINNQMNNQEFQFPMPENPAYQRSNQVDLNQLFNLVKENNHMLRAMRFNQRVQTFMRIVQIFFVIGLFGAGYYFVQPYLQKVIEIYNQVQTTAQTATEFKSTLTGGLLDFLKQ